MEPTNTEIQTAKDKLSEYADKIANGNTLQPKEDALELDVKHLGVKPRGFSYFPQVIPPGFPV